MTLADYLRLLEVIASLDQWTRTTTRIAQRFGVARQQLGPVLRQLERDGFVYSVATRRLVRWRLTEQGEALLRGYARAAQLALKDT